jgi:hypothetical protein
MTPPSIRQPFYRALTLLIALFALASSGVAQSYDAFVKKFDSAKEVKRSRSHDPRAQG